MYQCEAFNTTVLSDGANVVRRVPWPGGRGIVTAEFGGASGASAKVVVEGVQAPGPAPEWSMVEPYLSVDGINEITASGDYLIDLPPCVITFAIRLESSDTINLGKLTLVGE